MFSSSVIVAFFLNIISLVLDWLLGSVMGKYRPWDTFLESPGNFPGPKSRNKIVNLTITELLY